MEGFVSNLKGLSLMSLANNSDEEMSEKTMTPKEIEVI